MAESESRDRVEMDSDLRQVIVFMQANLPTDKLVQVAAKLGDIAPPAVGPVSTAGDSSNANRGGAYFC